MNHIYAIDNKVHKNKVLLDFKQLKWSKL